MSTFILVHGAFHGGWCWYRIVAHLQRAGHRVLAPDLKSLGVDRTPVSSITLETWTDQIATLARAQTDPVVLVGHSRGGIVLSAVAERIPDHVRTLVYVTAYLLENGHTVRAAAAADLDSRVGAAPRDHGCTIPASSTSARRMPWRPCHQPRRSTTHAGIPALPRTGHARHRSFAVLQPQ